METQEQKDNQDIKVPYVYAVAHPDYKRPWVHIKKGVVSHNDYQNFFLDKIVSDILYEHRNTLTSYLDIKKFFEEDYFVDGFIDNPPFEIDLFIDNKWTYYHPSAEEIFDYILHNKELREYYKLTLEESSEPSEPSESSEPSEPSESSEPI